MRFSQVERPFEPAPEIRRAPVLAESFLGANTAPDEPTPELGGARQPSQRHRRANEKVPSADVETQSGLWR
jgi:hypothetical protein